MKDRELEFNRECHALYTKQCKKEILECILKHYPKEQVDDIFTKVQLQFVDYLKNYRTDLGGKKNMHNGVAGTYDCIAIFSYYVVCKDVTSFEEIEQIGTNLMEGSFGKLKFVDLNKKIFRKLMYFAFCEAKKRCDEWKDFDMVLEPYSDTGPLRYHFTKCPVAEFAKDHDLLDILPALCNCDYVGMEQLHARLVRTETLAHGNQCDYAICGDKDSYLEEHEEFRDEYGGRWNR